MSAAVKADAHVELVKRRDQAMDLVRDTIRGEQARGYELGFAAGEKAGTEKAMATLSQNDVTVRGVTPGFKTELLQHLDRLQLFRQTIGTHDTRYSMLGEIIADFARAVGSDTVLRRIVDMRADQVRRGDELLLDTPNGEQWDAVYDVESSKGITTIHTDGTAGRAHWVHQDAGMIRVRRP